jgi:hypothetical protein
MSPCVFSDKTVDREQLAHHIPLIDLRLTPTIVAPCNNWLPELNHTIGEYDREVLASIEKVDTLSCCLVGKDGHEQSMLSN